MVCYVIGKLLMGLVFCDIVGKYVVCGDVVDYFV